MQLRTQAIPQRREPHRWVFRDKPQSHVEVCGYDRHMSETPHDGDSSVDEPLIEHDPTVYYDPGADTVGIDLEQRVAGAFRYALVVEGGPTAGMAYVLGDGETKVGRSEASDIFLGDVTVSRDHVVFHVDATGLRFVDAGSTNGTYINDERLSEAQLHPGDELIIGKFRLRVTSGTVEG